MDFEKIPVIEVRSDSTNPWHTLLSGTSISQEQVLREISERQSTLDGVDLDNDGISAHRGTKLSQGCVDCKNNKWITIFVGKACNATCSFCPQPIKPDLGDTRDTFANVSTSFGAENVDSIKEKIDTSAASGSITSVGYSGGEPLMYLDRIKIFSSHFFKNHPDLYQYVYTNGILLTTESLQELASVGIREIRFDLEATDFSQKILRKLASVKQHVDFLTVEIPALPSSRDNLFKHYSTLLDAGVDQINLCEVVINEFNLNHFRNADYYIVNPHRMNNIYSLSDEQLAEYDRIALYGSRSSTYDVIEMAERLAWKISINDCSQGIHYKPYNPLTQTQTQK